MQATAAIQGVLEEAAKHAPDGKHLAILATPLGFLLAYDEECDDEPPPSLAEGHLAYESDADELRRAFGL